MKGLLHRLAARAAGSAIAVRSDARLPFADSRARAGATEPRLEQSLAIGDTAPTIGTTDASAAPLDAAPHPAPMIDAPTSHVSARQVVSVEFAGAVRAQRAYPSSSGFDARMPPRLVGGAPGGDVRAGLHPTEFGIRPLDPAPPQEPVPALHSQRVATPAREPALLMPETVANPSPRPAQLAPTIAHATAGSTHGVPRDEPNEVHIHIGRIEVTAVQENAAPRRRAGPAAAPMSLQEYFAKRGRT